VVRPWVEGLSALDEHVVRGALRATADGPFFPDWEFPTLFGLEREEVREVLADWPRSADPDLQFNAVNNAMNNLLGYPHGQDGAWDEYLSVDREQLGEMLWRIRETSGANDETREYLTIELGHRSLWPDDALVRARLAVQALVTAADQYGVVVPLRLTNILAAWNRKLETDRPDADSHRVANQRDRSRDVGPERPASQHELD